MAPARQHQPTGGVRWIRARARARHRGWRDRRAGSRKLHNLRLDPRVTIVARAGWRWATVEGNAEIIGPDDPHPNVDSEVLRLLLRDIFRAAGGTHDDWEHLRPSDGRRATSRGPHRPPPRLHQPADLMTMTRDDVVELCAALPGAVED